MNPYNYIILDLETDGLDYRKDQIVAVGYKSYDVPFADTEYNPNFDNFNKYLEPYNLLVGHNIKFDLLFLWKCEELQDWFRQGGRIWDTQLVEYMLSGQQDKYPSLREIATKKYGCPERTKWIDLLLFDKKKTLDDINQPFSNNLFELCEPYLDQMESYQKVSDLPKDKVLEDVKNDVLDTEQVYLQQLELVRQRGKNFENLVMLEHDALLSTAEITYNGMFVDKNKLLENRKELEKQLIKKQAELMQIVQRYWK